MTLITPDRFPSAFRSWISNPLANSKSTRWSKLDLSTAGGIYLYGLAMLMLFIPIAILCFEAASRKWRAYLEDKPPLPPAQEISQLRVYPIKSCRGIMVENVRLLRTGLEFDRNWMFVDAKSKKFLTIRENSKMTLINTSLSEDGNKLTAEARSIDEAAHFTVATRPTKQWLEKNTTLITVEIWGCKHDAYAYPAEMVAPFQKVFDRDILFVLKGPTPRVLGANGHPKHLGRTESTKFADMAPVLVASEKSIAELNTRIAEKGENRITIERFRPNIIFKGTEAWNEDSWKTLRIHASNSKKPLTLDVLARCARCQVPNVEPTTGQKHQKEPWNTLMAYRRIDWGMKWKPCFGMLIAPRDEGEIMIGDSLEVTDTTKAHRIIMGFS